ncbi:MAG: hypothetical protein ABI338_09575 [Gemmatimonadaceae bacterium]
MDMSVTGGGAVRQRLVSPQGSTAVSQHFVMGWVSVWKDIVFGMLIAGTITVLVPRDC